MKIARVELFQVPPRWLFLKLTTDDGLSGFTAIKMNASEEMHYIDSFSKVEAIVARVAAVREATGLDSGIAVDFHGRIYKAMAKVVAKELEPFHVWRNVDGTVAEW